MNSPVTVVLFTHVCPDHPGRTLECLRQNDIPLLDAFSDGPSGPDGKAEAQH